MRNTAVYKTMRRDRFKQILQFIHCADNTNIDKEDKLYKLRPFINLLQKKFKEQFVPVENLDFDEAMIKYYGKHGCKQFIKGKPIRFGFKVWSLNTKDGYLLNFDIYQGKSPTTSEQNKRLFGKCTAPLISMISDISHSEYPYHFYLDNLFTSITLFDFLREQGYHVTGTFRDDRIPSTCPLISKKSMKKSEEKI
ncbi:Transposase IS4 [Popillia japonica]|uniref:Transposase IS4 n=1 Tax=Popillia japonica TaxID=7064 RepID=A0AAW1MFT7_POPJA